MSPCPQQAHRSLVTGGQVQHQGPALQLHQAHPDEEPEHPAQGGSLGRPALLVRQARPRLGQTPPQRLLLQGVDQKGQGHHHPQGHHPLRPLREGAAGEEQGVFEKPEAPLHRPPLVFVPPQCLPGRQGLPLQLPLVHLQAGQEAVAHREGRLPLPGTPHPPPAPLFLHPQADQAVEGSSRCGPAPRWTLLLQTQVQALESRTGRKQRCGKPPCCWES